MGSTFSAGVDTLKLMQSVALYNEEVTGPEHASACRVALADRGVAHLTISKDVQMMLLAADKRSMRNPGVRTSSSWSPPLPTPPADQLRGAAAILNSGKRVAVLVGQGALSARDEVGALADRLAPPSQRRSWARPYCPMTAPTRRAALATSAPHHQPGS